MADLNAEEGVIFILFTYFLKLSFTQEEVEKFIIEAIDNTILGKPYEEKYVKQWINLICESVMENLIKKALPFKFMVNCMIMQRNKAGMFAVTSCYYDTVTDCKKSLLENLIS